MKLPNRELAYVAKPKIKDYLLSETHVIGRSKAKFFRMFGFDENSLEQGLLRLRKLTRKFHHRMA